MHHRRVNFVALAALTLWATVIPDVRSWAQSPSLQEIIVEVRRAQDQLWNIGGGIYIRYTMTLEQDPAKPMLAWSDQIKGELVIRGQEFRTRNEGVLSFKTVNKRTGESIRVTEPTFRNAYYSFDTGEGVAREGNDLVQVTPYRHTFAKSTNYFLQYMFHERVGLSSDDPSKEVDKLLLPGIFESTDGWSVSQEQRDGQDILVVKGKFQTIYIDPQRSYLVVRREFFGPDGAIVDLYEAEQLRQIKSELWIPQVLTRTLRLPEEAKAFASDFKAVLKVDGVSIGSVSDADLAVQIDDEVASIEDQISNEIYKPSASSDEAFARAEEFLIERSPSTSTKSVRKTMLVVGAAAVAIALGWLAYTRVSARSSDEAS